MDMNLAKRLWEVSETLVGLKSKNNNNNNNNNLNNNIKNKNQ